MLIPGYLLDDRYEIGNLLASGGMGSVYRARRVMLDDQVAIKVIRAVGEDPQVLRDRFMNESRTCAQLRHPNIVSILDFAIGPTGDPYLVMEYLNGPSLRDELAAHGPMDPLKVHRIIGPICGALQLAHDRRILHRDLKPANIVSHRYESGETVYKVIDFGLANVLADADGEETHAAGFMGTVIYASPEQLQGEELDCRSDIYSLAAVVFEMLTGRPPFESTTSLGVMTKHLCDAPPAASSIHLRVPAWLDVTLQRALAKDRDERFASMTDFARALAGGESVVTAPPPPASVLLTKYDLGPVIAQGRLGSQVHAGTHRALGVPVAVRVLRRGDRRDWEAVRSRFLKEARSLQVSHPSVIQVRDFGEEQDTLYVVTDLIEGRSLLELLDAEAPFAWPRLSRFVSQLADATAALHRRGTFLCGLNPSIIRTTTDEDGERLMISTGGISQVQDLLATQNEAVLRGGALNDSEMPYIAPEVLTGQPVSVAADLFTVGVLAYEMATGGQPYAGRTMPELLGAMMVGQPRDANLVRPDLPLTAARALMRCLDREPAARFGAAGEFRRAWETAGA